jgi:hypothetical protein
MAHELWNKRISRYVTVEDDFSSISWTFNEPCDGVTCTVEAVSNGFVITQSGVNGNTRYVTTGFWDMQGKLKDIMMYSRTFEEIFTAEDYSADDLKKAGYVKDPADAS